MKGKMSVLTAVAAIALVVQGCASKDAGSKDAGAGAATSSPTATATASPPPSPTSNKPVTITWWHASGGTNGEAINKIVGDFNSSQSRITVKAEFQGGYDELLNKLKASLDSSNGPSMVMVNDVNTRFMVDSKKITKVQTFMNRDSFSTADFEEHILNYYKINNEFYSMPFNTSNAILYYNKDMFKAAGLNPDKPPVTFEEVSAAAKALTKTGVTGFAFYVEPWFMEQTFAKQGELYVNNDNGRSASPASESFMNKAAGVKTLTWWKSMIDQKIALNFGKSTDAKKAFTAGQAAMYITSTGSLKANVDETNGKFEIGTGFFPVPSDLTKEGGVAVGGGSNWIMNNKSKDEQDAAWEFIKYLSTPKVQAYLHINSGYFPITKKAYDDQSVKDNLAKYPQYKTAIDQLHQSRSTFASQGASIGVFQELRGYVSTAIEEAINGSKSPQDALNAAAANSNKALAKYNDMNK